MGIMKSLSKNKFTKTVMCGLIVSSGMMAGMNQADAEPEPTLAANITGAEYDAIWGWKGTSGTEIKVT